MRLSILLVTLSEVLARFLGERFLHVWPAYYTLTIAMIEPLLNFNTIASPLHIYLD